VNQRIPLLLHLHLDDGEAGLHSIRSLQMMIIMMSLQPRLLHHLLHQYNKVLLM